MFIGRHTELEQLLKLKQKKTASLAVITGRRRIGKSRLVRECAKQFSSFIELSGLPPAAGVGPKEQRQEFLRQLKVLTGLPPIQTDDWGDIFLYLARHTAQGEVLILLDELSWMASDDPLFLSQLKTAWDLYFTKNNKLVMVLCSSVSSWIDDNLVSSTGFVGRISLHQRLRELPINLCLAFWQNLEERISKNEILKVLSVTGGVPRYLEEIDPHESAEQNIARLCFREGAFLFDEYERLFSQLFTRKAPGLGELVKLLADGALSFEEIESRRSVASGGSLSKQLKVLAACGFITRDYTWLIKAGKPSKLSKFRLSDKSRHSQTKNTTRIIQKPRNASRSTGRARKRCGDIEILRHPTISRAARATAVAVHALAIVCVAFLTLSFACCKKKEHSTTTHEPTSNQSSPISKPLQGNAPMTTDPVSTGWGRPLRVTHPSPHADGTLDIDPVGRLIFANDNAMSGIWADGADLQIRNNELVWVSWSAKDRRVRDMIRPLLSSIMKIDTKGSEMRVLTVTSPSFYFLKQSHPEYASLLPLLQAALRTEAAVLIAINPKSNEIVDVRLAN